MVQTQKDHADRIRELNSSNSDFSVKNGFLSMELTFDGEKKVFDRVFLHRIFPLEMLWEYVSVLDEHSKELGIIRKISDFDDNTRALLETELERKYYTPKIKTILSQKERYGFSYWKVKTDDGREVNFTMQDTFSNILRVGEDKAILLDVDGNRFEIVSIKSLDRKSYKKIEIYL